MSREWNGLLRAALITLVVVSSAIRPTSGETGSYTFTVIADSSGPFIDLRPAVINDRGDVAILATLEGGGQAIVRHDRDGLTTLASIVGVAGALFNGPNINTKGIVVFGERDPITGATVRIMAGHDSESLVAIADTTSAFADLYGLPVISDSREVVFSAKLRDGSQGLFRRDLAGGPVTTLVTTGAQFSGFDGGPAVNRSGEVAFKASLAEGGEGIFILNAHGLQAIATSAGPLHLFSSAPNISDSGEVTFHACLDAGPCGAFLATGEEPPRLIVESGFSPDINNRGLLAFQGAPVGAPMGVFTNLDGVTEAVVQVGDVVLGQVLEGLEFFRGLNNSGKIVFTGFFNSGHEIVVILAEPKEKD